MKISYAKNKNKSLFVDVDANAYTLSEQGAPCHYDTSDFTCAICIPGKYLQYLPSYTSDFKSRVAYFLNF